MAGPVPIDLASSSSELSEDERILPSEPPPEPPAAQQQEGQGTGQRQQHRGKAKAKRKPKKVGVWLCVCCGVVWSIDALPRSLVAYAARRARFVAAAACSCLLLLLLCAGMVAHR